MRTRGTNVTRRARWLVMAAMVAGASRAGAQSGDGSVPPTPTHAAPVIQRAPGGGDMVILGPESRYITEAWRDESGRVRGKCGNPPAGATRPCEKGQR